MIIPSEVEHIKIEYLNDFPDHPFKVQLDESMQNLIQSIYDHGITSPLLLWEIAPDYYIILSGHRRAYSRIYLNEQGLTNELTVPALIYRDITLEEATIIMVDENAKRERLLPSERAFAYKMKMDAMKRQGERTDLTSVPMAQKSKTTRELIAEESGESADQVRRYIRLTFLVPELLTLVDNNVLGFRAAVEISYLSENEQKALLEIMERADRAPDLRQAKLLKAASKDLSLNKEKTEEILCAVRYDDRVSFRLRPAQLKQLDEVSKSTNINRSEILRAYTSTGGTIYVGRNTIEEIRDIHINITKLGNLMKMQQNRLDAIAENPFIASEDRAYFENTMGEFQSLYKDIKKQLKRLDKVTDSLNETVSDLNGNIHS